MIVTDASVLVNALTDDGPAGAASRAELAGDLHWAGPEHLPVEVFSAIRGRLLGREIAETRAEEAIEALAAARIERIGTTALLPRMWQLRANLSGYDAGYVAAAELLDCPLLTADTRLARATGIHCRTRIPRP